MGAVRSRAIKRSGEPTSQQAELIRQKAIILFTRYGYSATRMDDLAHETKLNKGTIYYYYKSKSDILYDIVMKSASGSLNVLISRKILGTFEETFTAFIHEATVWFLENREVTSIFAQEMRYLDDILTPDQAKNIHGCERRYRHEITEWIKGAVAAGDLADCDVRVTARIVTSTIISTTRWARATENPDVVAREICRILLNGIIAKQ